MLMINDSLFFWAASETFSAREQFKIRYSKTTRYTDFSAVFPKTWKKFIKQLVLSLIICVLCTICKRTSMKLFELFHCINITVINQNKTHQCKINRCVAPLAQAKYNLYFKCCFLILNR